MKYYAGLDVSLEETAIRIVDEAGAMVREMRVPSEPEALVDAFHKLGSRLKGWSQVVPEGTRAR